MGGRQHYRRQWADEGAGSSVHMHTRSEAQTKFGTQIVLSLFCPIAVHIGLTVLHDSNPFNTAYVGRALLFILAVSSCCFVHDNGPNRRRGAHTFNSALVCGIASVLGCGTAMGLIAWTYQPNRGTDLAIATGVLAGCVTAAYILGMCLQTCMVHYVGEGCTAYTYTRFLAAAAALVAILAVTTDALETGRHGAAVACTSGALATVAVLLPRHDTCGAGPRSLDLLSKFIVTFGASCGCLCFFHLGGAAE